MRKLVSAGAPLMSSLEGQMLGQYQVIAQMGSGGMATVYRGYHPRLDRTVAIKMLHEMFREDKNFHTRFEREAQIVARLDHPHIVPVFDFDEYNGRPYLVMKYIEGQTLKAVLDNHAVTMDEILRLLPPIAAALDYAHRQGVLHRDIKPSNIIIDASGVPYVTDFGLARMAQLGESTLSQDVLLGTPHYISPEQAMGSRELDSRTDLYSLGIILYELVVGRVPFSADTPFAVIHDQIYRELPKPSSINPEVTPEIDTVLEKALAKAPANRYATATEMVEAFRRAVEQSGIKTLNPERASLASASLAKARDAQNRLTPSAAFPLPEAAEAPAARASHSAADRAFDELFENEIPAVPQPPRVPTPPTPGKSKRVVEASFDFSEGLGKVLHDTDRALRTAFDSISTSADPAVDIDFAPLDDEVAMRKRIETEFNKRKEFTIHLVVFVLVIALQWIIFGSGFSDVLFADDADLGQIIGFPWPLIVMLGWGAGLAAHAVETYYTTGQRARARIEAIHAELYNTYGEDWQRMSRKELRKVRSRVQEQFNKRKEWLQHLGAYLPINLMLWIIFLTTGGGFPWALVVSLGWGIGLVIHAIDSRSHTSREKAISRAVERERDRLYNSEKPKRDRYADDSYAERGSDVRLTEDGEFTDSMIEQIEDEARSKRSRR